MKLILQTANIVGDEKNCLYPNRVEVTSAEELQEAVKMDHVCAEYDNDYRSKENFRQSNVLVMDCDNDHSEDPEEWKTPEDVGQAFPGVPFYVIYSRHHMKQKNKYSSRPRFHVIFPIEPVTDSNAYRSLKDSVIAFFPYFDTNAKDSARFFFGVKSPVVEYHGGAKDEFE